MTPHSTDAKVREEVCEFWKAFELDDPHTA